jgi:hypothetical protein
LEEEFHDVGDSHDNSSESDGALVILKTPESNHEHLSFSLGVRDGSLSVVPLGSSSRDDEEGKTTDEKGDPQEGEHVVVEGHSSSSGPHDVGNWKIGIWLYKTNRVKLNGKSSPHKKPDELKSPAAKWQELNHWIVIHIVRGASDQRGRKTKSLVAQAHEAEISKGKTHASVSSPRVVLISIGLELVVFSSFIENKSNS